MVGFETVDTIRQFALQAEEKYLEEFEEANYETLKNIYNKIIDSAGRGEWELRINRFEDYPNIDKDDLKLYLLNKEFYVEVCDAHSMIISWLPNDEEDYTWHFNIIRI